MEVTYTSAGGLFLGVDEADHEQMVRLLIELNSAPGAKDAVKALMRSGHNIEADDMEATPDTAA